MNEATSAPYKEGKNLFHCFYLTGVRCEFMLRAVPHPSLAKKENKELKLLISLQMSKAIRSAIIYRFYAHGMLRMHESGTHRCHFPFR